MDLLNLVFYLFAIITVVSAIIVVTHRNIMYAAFALLFTLFGVAGLYAMLNADFIAVAQIMIYIGGILVLLIFGVMLTSNITGVDLKTGSMSKLQRWIMTVISLLIAIGLAIMYSTTDWVRKDIPEVNSTVDTIGNLLLTDYLIAFEVASVLLLIAIIGAALIARHKTR